MLKVVGASWLKTRISSYILVAALLLAIGSLFLAEMDRPKYNGVYCATVYYSGVYHSFRTKYWGQQNDLQNVDKGAVRTCYKDSTKKNGWAQIEIETQPDYPDWVQAFGAGMLEGALTWSSIYDHWSNTIKAYCEQDEPSQRFCAWLRESLEVHYTPLIDYADRKGKTDNYWHQIRVFYHQIEGLAYGFREGVDRSREEFELDRVDFLLLNAAADLPDYRIYYENFVNASTEYEYTPEPVKASMMVKFLMDQQSRTPNKVLLGHSSDGNYASMLRCLKKYKFHFHGINKTLHKPREVHGVDIAFTGYPGGLASSDDFYIVSGKRSKLTVAGIRLQNHNVDLWRTVGMRRTALLSARVMAANRLAHSGKSWTMVMKKNPSFGSKQWMVVDVKRMHNVTSMAQAQLIGEPTPITATEFEMADEQPITVIEEVKPPRTRNGAIWIVDQLPGRLHAEDMTKEIVYDNGVWTGNGIPYFKETLEASHIEYNDVAQKSFQKVSSSNITDLEAVAKVLKSRAYRGDLMGENASAFGNIDIKLFSETSSAKMEFRALAGPLFYNTMRSKPKDMAMPIVALSATTSTTIDDQKHTDDQSVNADPSRTAEVSAAITGTTTIPITTTPIPITTAVQDNVNDDDDDDSLVSDHEMLEIDITSERRMVRHDIRANAVLKQNVPFTWSKTKLDVEHAGHPNVWNFDHVSPTWAWKHDTV